MKKLITTPGLFLTSILKVVGETVAPKRRPKKQLRETDIRKSRRRRTVDVMRDMTEINHITLP